MKKIYMILAAISLLSLSLNAQDGAKAIDKASITEKAPKFTATAHNLAQNKTATNKVSNFSFDQVLHGIKGMSSILQASQTNSLASASGQSRAPLRLNSDEVTVGPFEGDNFSTSGLGFPTAYGDNYQQIYITTELDRDEFISHNGDEIIGFRFALAGNSSQTAVLYDFIAWPHSNNYFSQNRYTWSIPEYTDATPINTFDDIVITTSAGTTTNFRSITVYDQDDNVLTSWDYNGTTSTVTSGGSTYTYYVMPDGWTLSNVYLFKYGSGTSAVGYLSTASSASITISKDLLAGSSSVRVVIYVYGDNGTETFDVNGNTRTLSTSSSSNYTYNFNPTGTSAPVYVELAAGQWYDCYLDEPITFNVADSIVGLRMGYRYFQYPSTMTNELLYPIAVNPQSTNHSHISYMVKPYGSTTSNQLLTGWHYSTDASTFPSTWAVPSVGGSGSLSGSYWFSGSSGGTFTIPASDLQGCSTVTVKVTAGKENTNTHSISVNNSSRNLTTSLVEYTWENVNASNGITITYSDYYVDISAIEVYGDVTAPNYQQGWWTEDFSQYGDLAVQLIFKNDNKTPAPEITYQVNGDNVVVTATGEGTVTLTIGDQTAEGNGSASITLPRTDTTYSVTATATAKDGDKEVSDPTTEVVTVPFLQTDAPVINYTIDGETVTITATGDGTVTLTVDGQTVEGNGSASITLPCGVVSKTVTATATAQENGKAVSETTTREVTIPAGEGWLLMDGTYDNPNTLLSFLADGKDIMMVDQFLASTLNNDHPDHYNYVIKETIDNEEKTSSPVTIPVYKTSSTMQGFYTYEEVMADTDMHLTADVINSEMDFDVVPDRNTLYYNMYRGEKNAAYPVIDIPSRVSQLQKYEEMVGDNVQYFFTETYPSGILPKYDHVGNEMVERLDVKYVQGQMGDELSYVPVIWTFGLYTAREDGKNNSYGSDIKREKLGGVDAIIGGSKSDQRQQGQWTASNDTTYCVYTPVITITGMPPIEKVDNDGDVSTYYPFMYRAWCTYSKARDFAHNADGQLTDAGPMQVPFLLATDMNDQTISHIGREWNPGEGRLDWAFGVPLTEDPHNVGFVIRFYYRKAVTNYTNGQDDGANTYRLGDGPAEEYYVVETRGDGSSISTAIGELFNGPSVVSQTYYNVQGMKSETPFDGINIVVTRFSDGTTTTTKVVR